MSAPIGVMLEGLVLGTGTGLLAVGLVLTYRSTRILNFSYGALGALGAAVGVSLKLGPGWPWPVCVAVAIAVGVLAGVLTEWLVIRRFAGRSRLTLTVATIGLAQLLGGLELLVPGWLNSQRIVGGFTTGLSSIHIRVDPVLITGDSLVLLVIAPVAIAALVWFLYRTDAGVAVRGMGENRERALLLGIPVNRLSTLVWGIAGGLAALTIVIVSPSQGLSLTAAAGPFLILPALAAAVVADLENLPLAFGAGVGLGVLDQVVRWNVDQQAISTLVFLAVILLALAIRRPGRSTAGDEESAWAAGPSHRRRPVASTGDSAAAAETSGRTWFRNPGQRRAVGASVVGVLALALLATTATAGQINRLSAAAILGIIALSLVPLAGWGGAISLGQMAVAGVGGVVAANLLARSRMDLFLVLGLATVAGAAIAAVLGVPALRIRGIYLAVTTLAFAVVADAWVLNPANFPGLFPSSFDRPSLFGQIDLAPERPFFYLCLACLVVSAVLVANLRRGRPGRVLLAVRDNAPAGAAYGLSPSGVKLSAFIVSGALAGLAGALYVTLLGGISYHTFEPASSLLVFSMAVIGGIESPWATLLGVLLVEAVGYEIPGYQLVITGVGVLVVLWLIPQGLAAALDGLLSRLGRGSKRAAAAATVPVPGGSAAEAGAAAAVGSAPALLRLEGVEAGYGSLPVLFGVDLAVGEGELVALLGTNGAGKSTLLNCIAGLLRTSDGALHFGDLDLATADPGAAARAGLALMPGGRGLFPSLTVAENLRLAAWTHRKDRVAATEAGQQAQALLPATITDRPGVHAGLLSGGQQQLVSLAMAMATRPRLLCLDELSLGLAPAMVQTLADHVRRIHRDGVTVIIVDQSIDVALTLAERAVFLDKGVVRYSGPTADLLDRPDLLRSVFLGEPAAASADPAPQASVTPRVPSPVRPASSSEPILACTGMARNFAGIAAVADVDLMVGPGRVVGLVGHNGSGKTTLLNLLSGFLAADAGRVTLAGQDVTGWPAQARAHAGLGRTFQDGRLFPALTVREALSVAYDQHLANRDVVAAAFRLPAARWSESAARAEADRWIDQLHLGDYADHRLAELSMGTRRVVGLACALTQAPSVVLLDEPSAGLAQREVEALAPMLRQVRDTSGAALLIVEHNIALLREVADELVAMESGQVVTTGPTETVLADPRVVASWLGSESAAD